MTDYNVVRVIYIQDNDYFQKFVYALVKEWVE